MQQVEKQPSLQNTEHIEEWILSHGYEDDEEENNSRNI